MRGSSRPALASQRASERPICSLCWRSSLDSRVLATQALRDATLSRSSRCQARNALAITASSLRDRPRCSWSSNQSRGIRLAGHEARVDRRLETLRVAEAADRQRRRREPDQAQQRSGAERGPACVWRRGGMRCARRARPSCRAVIVLVAVTMIVIVVVVVVVIVIVALALAMVRQFVRDARGHVRAHGPSAPCACARAAGRIGTRPPARTQPPLR